MREKFRAHLRYSRNWLILICLFLIATRLWQISSNPPSLYWDESSIGYNAYSILKTGHDEWGNRFPIHFRAFGEFKLPVYIYSTVITEAVFGLTPIAIRLPAVLYSLGSLLLIYFLVKKISQSEVAGLFASFYFTISPWYFIFSRTGYEATAGLFFFLLAIYLFIISRKKRLFFIYSVISLIFSIYSYNSFRLLSCFTLMAALGYTLWSNRSKKTFFVCIICLILFAISIIPIIRLLLFDAGFGRTESFALLPNIQQVYDLKGQPHYQVIYDRSKKNDWTGTFFSISKNYLSHFSPRFLLLNGDPNPRNQQPGFGQLYFIDIALLILGLFALFRLRKFYAALLLFLLIISPIPAALFKEAPHALRSVLTPAVLAMLVGLGSWWLINKSRWMIYVLIGAWVVFFGYYFFNFFVVYPVKASAEWQYGYQQIYQQYQDQFSKYDKIIISDDYAQPYIFPLVYLKIDPREFQKNAVRNPINDWGFSTVNHFDKFYFVKENNLDLNYPGKLLVFMTKPWGNRLPDHQINFLNGQPALFVYTIQK